MTTTRANSERVERFIEAFHTYPANKIWKDLDPSSTVGKYLTPFLQVLHENTEVPAVLFRIHPDRPDRLSAYVIPLNRSHAAVVAELLQAFVGPSWSTWDGRPADLSADDPVDAAVRDYVGDTTVFVLSIPKKRQADAVYMLRKMQATIRSRPFRTWHAPRPVGRLLAEFDVALAAGDNSTSDNLLRQIRATGGLTAANLAHLRIKQMSRLGQSGSLLRMPELDDVIAAEPPTPVRDAILTAMYHSGIAEPIASGDLGRAAEVLRSLGHRLLLLWDTSFVRLSAEALTVLSLAAWMRDQPEALLRLKLVPGAVDKVAVLAPALAAQIQASAPHSPVAAVPTQEPPAASLGSWSELVLAMSQDSQLVKQALKENTWQDWPPPSDEDADLAAAVEAANESDGDSVWGIVGAFLDASGYDYPPFRTARALITNAVYYERYQPGDLAGLVALVGMVLRSAPDKTAYRDLLEEVGEQADRWASVERSTVVLDLIDLLSRHAVPDTISRQQLGYKLLQPLHRSCRLLEQDQVELAKLLAGEIGVVFDWPELAVDDETVDRFSALELNLLLYSLNEDALSSTRELLLEKAPRLKISLCSDHVGSTRLKQLARNADIVVLATRAAKHAATAFIQDNARTGRVGFADGGGLASLHRKAVELLRKHIE